MRLLSYSTANAIGGCPIGPTVVVAITCAFWLMLLASTRRTLSIASGGTEVTRSANTTVPVTAGIERPLGASLPPQAPSAAARPSVARMRLVRMDWPPGCWAIGKTPAAGAGPAIVQRATNHDNHRRSSGGAGRRPPGDARGLAARVSVVPSRRSPSVDRTRGWTDTVATPAPALPWPGRAR